MKNYTRRGIAYAISEILCMNKSSIYDWNETKYYSFNSGNNIYDCTELAYITLKNVNQDEYELFHYKHNKSINLKIQNGQFEGYDYDCNKHFSGEVNGQDIKIYDYEFGKWYSYSVS